MKTILFLLVLLGLLSCKSNKSSNNSTEKVEESTELVPLDKFESKPNTDAKVVNEIPEQETESAADVSTGSIYGKWRILVIKEAGKAIDLPYLDWDMQLTFTEENENIQVKSPCNSGGCKYELEENKISIESNCGFTEMYCEEEQKNIWEKKLIDVLADQSQVISLNELSLILNGSVYNIELSRVQ